MDALEYIHKYNVIHFDLHTGNLAVGFKNNSRIYLFGNLNNFEISNKYVTGYLIVSSTLSIDFNVAQEFEIIDGSIILKEMSLHEEFYRRTGMSPRFDIKQLVDMLLDFLGAHVLDYPHHMPQLYKVYHSLNFEILLFNLNFC